MIRISKKMRLSLKSYFINLQTTDYLNNPEEEFSSFRCIKISD